MESKITVRITDSPTPGYFEWSAVDEVWAFPKPDAPPFHGLVGAGGTSTSKQSRKPSPPASGVVRQ
jgi:hypothetical protein